MKDSVVSVRRSSVWLFYLHSVLAVYILLFFQEIVQTLYLVQGENVASFYVFAEILPGLIFFSAVTSQEPLYEAVGKVAALQKNILAAASLNFIGNCFFVPFGGFFGAAFATSVTMFAYFLMYGRGLKPMRLLPKARFFYAGAAVYLAYILFRRFDLGVLPAVMTVPVVLFVMFYLVGLFDFESDPAIPAMDS